MLPPALLGNNLHLCKLSLGNKSFRLTAWWHEKITLSTHVPGEMRSQALATCLASGYLMYKFGQALNWLCFNFWFLFSLTSALLRGLERFVLFIAFLGKAVESRSQILTNGLGFSGHSLQQRLCSPAFLMVWHLHPCGYPHPHSQSSHQCF